MNPTKSVVVVPDSVVLSERPFRAIKDCAIRAARATARVNAEAKAERERLARSEDAEGHRNSEAG